MYQFTPVKGNYKQVLDLILKKYKGEALSYVYDALFVHCYSANGVVFAVMSRDDLSRKRAQEFLTKFSELYRNRDLIDAPSDSSGKSTNTFTTQVKALCVQFEEPDSVGLLKSDLDSVKQLMNANIEKVLERGERMDVLMDRTESLTLQSQQFRQTARGLKRGEYWKNKKISIAIGLAVVLALVIIFIVLLH